jgi:hypothetical protein
MSTRVSSDSEYSAEMSETESGIRWSRFEVDRN